MKVTAIRLVVGACLVAGLVAPVALAQDAPKAALALGASAPMASVKMKNVDGKELALSDVMGKKGTLVVFTCNHCPYAVAWEDRIVSLGNTYSGKGIGVVAVNSNDPAIVEGDSYPAMQTRAKDKKFGFPYVVDEDSKLAKSFGATRTPEAFLFDAQGKLVYHGTIDDNHKEAGKVTKTYLKDALDAVADGKPVATAETKAVGCSIKFKKTA
jgi:peroxiredoxin